MWTGYQHTRPNHPALPYLSPGPWGLSCGWHRRHCRAWSGPHSTERIPPERTALSRLKRKSAMSSFPSPCRPGSRREQGNHTCLALCTKQRLHACQSLSLLTEVLKLTVGKIFWLKMNSTDVGFCLLSIYSRIAQWPVWDVWTLMRK